jgi:glycerol-3-phosphate dehydrogenase (NAD(P)+)|tara:strand:- start:538 stop:1566 length:1029 start_codon:yes stop_codon:yes gene_type:complete
MKKILVLGAGAMGSAFTVPCIDNKNNVTLVGTHIEDEIISKITSKNNLHPGLKCHLDQSLKIEKFENLSKIFKQKPDLIVVGVSSKGIDWAGNEIAKYYIESTPILLLTKGLTLIDNQIKTLSVKLKKILSKKGLKKINISVVKGPCLAQGLANKIRTSVVIANENISIAKTIGKIISTNYYSIEYSKDVVGVEVCAAIKNIYSMLIGAAEGLSSSTANIDVKRKNYLNTAASLLKKSISEMVYLTTYFKGKEETVYGLAGLGDLYVSALGGRNSRMGKYLGDGLAYNKAKKDFMSNDTIEAGELVLEIGPKILKEFDKNKIPLMTNLIESICHNKKLDINW